MTNFTDRRSPAPQAVHQSRKGRGLRWFRGFILICAWALSFACSAQKTGQAAPTNWDLDQKSKTMLNVLMLSDSLIRGDLGAAKNAAHALADLTPSPSVYLENAALFLSLHDTAEAEKFIAEGLEKFPDNPPLTLLQAQLYAQSGDREGAVNLLAGYLRKYPKGPADKDSKADLNEVRLWLARLYLANKKPDEALKVVRAIPDKERKAPAMLLESRILYTQKKTKEAKAVLSGLVKKEPRLQEAWLALAAFAEDVKDYKEAASAYRKVLDIDPENNESRLRLVDALIKESKPDEALEAARDKAASPESRLDAVALFMEERLFDQAGALLRELKDTPGAPDEVNFYLAALMYEKERNLPEALRLLDAIPGDSQARPKALRMKVLLLLENGDMEKAIETADAARGEFPDDPDNFMFLSQLYARNKDFSKAESVIREAVAKWPDQPELLFSLGSILDVTGKKDQAMRIMEEILLINPDHSGALNYIGYTLAERGQDLPRALELINKALKTEPNASHIVDSLAWAHYKSGNYQEAWKAIQRCIELGANDPTIWEHYGDIALALGKKTEASKAYKDALDLDPENPDALRAKLDSIK